MSGVYLFDLASLQARHLAVRQATIAGNVANANTPEYRARDVKPFSEIMAQTGSQMARTASAHVDGSGPSIRTGDSAEGWGVLGTSSSVSLEQEMLKASDVSREHNLNTGIVRAFDRMLKLAVKA